MTFNFFKEKRKCDSVVVHCCCVVSLGRKVKVMVKKQKKKKSCSVRSQSSRSSPGLSPKQIGILSFSSMIFFGKWDLLRLCYLFFNVIPVKSIKY